MTGPREPQAFADMESLVAAIMSSPIVVRRTALLALLADWEHTRRSPDVDEVILAWIASHIDGAGRRATLS